MLGKKDYLEFADREDRKKGATIDEANLGKETAFVIKRFHHNTTGSIYMKDFQDDMNRLVQSDEDDSDCFSHLQISGKDSAPGIARPSAVVQNGLFDEHRSLRRSVEQRRNSLPSEDQMEWQLGPGHGTFAVEYWRSEETSLAREVANLRHLGKDCNYVVKFFGISRSSCGALDMWFEYSRIGDLQTFTGLYHYNKRARFIGACTDVLPTIKAQFCEVYMCCKELGEKTILNSARKVAASKAGVFAMTIDEKLLITGVRDICSAVWFLHEKRGMVHRDLKPGNILVFWDSKRCIRLKLCDFGMSSLNSSEATYPNSPWMTAKVRAESETSFITTAEYRAPEVWRNVMNDRANAEHDPDKTWNRCARLWRKGVPRTRKYVAHSSNEDKDLLTPIRSASVDIWSLGIVLLELCAGFCMSFQHGLGVHTELREIRKFKKRCKSETRGNLEFPDSQTPHFDVEDSPNATSRFENEQKANDDIEINDREFKVDEPFDSDIAFDRLEAGFIDMSRTMDKYAETHWPCSKLDHHLDSFSREVMIDTLGLTRYVMALMGSSTEVDEFDKLLISMDSAFSQNGHTFNPFPGIGQLLETQSQRFFDLLEMNLFVAFGRVPSNLERHDPECARIKRNLAACNRVPSTGFPMRLLEAIKCMLVVDPEKRPTIGDLIDCHSCLRH